MVVSERRVVIRQNMNSADNEANTRAIDSLLNYETVKYFNNESHEIARYNKALLRYETAAIRAQTSLTYLNIGQGIIISIGLGWVMLMAAMGVKNGTNTVGDFVLVNTFLIQLYIPLNFLGFVYRTIKQSLVDMGSMFEMMDVKPEIQDHAEAKELVVNSGKIEFSEVNFAYDSRRPVLRGVSFEVPAGTSVAIVGASGAGKSTITRLLYRFYDLQSGQIRIDDQSLSEVTQNSVRRAIGIVPQDPDIFSGTARENIRLGNVDASDEDIIKAAKMASAMEFLLALPQGLDTHLGEKGVRLSGGQRQRIAIARAVIRNPKILLLDEATSALDSENEHAIQQALEQVTQGRTTFVIAHRLSTITKADHIILMNEGRIEAVGTHTELLEKSPLYARLAELQFKAA
ncbi:MAG: ABC transporter ATP-binding protein/permease [Alphaproteobacteria bacterium]|nr:ABC transporter ATP-binding protein/permease [Alphaproteobacteria bacterium]